MLSPILNLQFRVKKENACTVEIKNMKVLFKDRKRKKDLLKNHVFIYQK